MLDGTCTVVCLNVPQGLEIGMDCFAFRVTDKFRGFVRVPRGLHIVHYSCTPHNHMEHGCGPSVLDHALKRSFFLRLRDANEVVVLAWDADKEDMRIVQECMNERDLLASGPSSITIDDSLSERGDVDETELRRMFEQMMVENRDRAEGLGPYPLEQYQQWNRLSQEITWPVVERLQPVKRKILSSVESEPADAAEEAKLVEQLHHYQRSKGASSQIHSNDEKVQQQQHQQQQQSKLEEEEEGTKIFFKHIPRKLVKKGLTPQQITKINFDKSELLEQLLRTEYDGEEDSLIAEFQFAFICFYVSHNLQGFEQWKSMIHMLCNCEEAIQHHPHLFLRIVQTLHTQIEVIPEDFFTGDLHTDNFLNKCLESLFEIVLTDIDGHELAGHDIGHLKEATTKLRNLTQQKFQWNIEHEMGENDDIEDGPIIVDL